MLLIDLHIIFLQLSRYLRIKLYVSLSRQVGAGVLINEFNQQKLI